MSNHVLVVDDDPGVRRMVALVLESEGYPVTTAANGAEAVEQLERDPPAAMLLDMQMPVLDGWGVARWMRKRGRRVPTVVMTAAGNAARWCADIAADAFLSKPFDIDDLVRVVRRIWALRPADGHAL